MGFKITTSTTLNAAPSEVWAVLTDFAAYSDWNPFITHAAGDWAVGNTVAVTAGGMDFKPEVLVFEEGKELRWRGKLLFNGLFDGEHYFVLTDQGNGTTLLEHGEQFTGILTEPLRGMIYEKTKAGFEKMNEALGERVLTR